MVFIDYITLLLINMTAGFVLLSAFLVLGLNQPDKRSWAPAFLMVGLVAVLFGGHMTTSWPVIGPYNSAYGEMSVLFGVIFVGAAIAMALGWELTWVAVYALVAGSAAVLVGVRFATLGLTLTPMITAVGFILSGLGGVFAAPTLLWFGKSAPFRYLAALVLLAAAGIWGLTAALGYWDHMDRFEDWVPVVRVASAK